PERREACPVDRDERGGNGRPPSGRVEGARLPQLRPAAGLHLPYRRERSPRTAHLLVLHGERGARPLGGGGLERLPGGDSCGKSRGQPGPPNTRALRLGSVGGTNRGLWRWE